MKTIRVKGSNYTSEVHVGETLKNVDVYLPDRPVIIITDETVKYHYETDFPSAEVITIPCGESFKTLATLEKIYRELVRLEADRQTFILGIGGGIVCDITGFAASTYMRGLRFGFVSTTLLSQVDASVGGKNGVNFDAYKNMVGLFCQPEFVICDTTLLNTLPPSEVSNGFAEIVKHALIADRAMFDFIESNWEKSLGLDHDVITRLVIDSVIIKGGVVEKDEKEAGERRKLNFGHTIGHALEKVEKTSHGKAVSMGMVAAARFSEERGFLTSDDCEKITDLLDHLNLPTGYDTPSSLVAQAVRRDKKRSGLSLHFVFLSAIGRSRVETISLDELERFVGKL